MKWKIKKISLNLIIKINHICRNNTQKLSYYWNTTCIRALFNEVDLKKSNLNDFFILKPEKPDQAQ